ncbi:MAG: hypothetical protein SF029_07325 [bacterium]|nr:hypothetical protein [bacterium]
MKNTRSAHHLAPPSGPAMQERLKLVGIHAQKVVRHRDTGLYVADFFVPGMETPIRPSQDWAGLMEERLVGLTIISMNDTVADWRSDRPVIWASVTFRIHKSELPQPSQQPSSPRWLMG